MDASGIGGGFPDYGAQDCLNERGAGGIGQNVEQFETSVGHEELMDLVTDPVDRGEQDRGQEQKLQVDRFVRTVESER